MRKHEVLDRILTDQEKAEILKFVENPAMMEAVRKVLLYDIYYAGVLKKGREANPGSNSAFLLVSTPIQADTPTNEELGQVLRGQWEGIQYLEIGFQELEKFKIEPKEKVVDNKNPAR